MSGYACLGEKLKMDDTEKHYIKLLFGRNLAKFEELKKQVKEELKKDEEKKEKPHKGAWEAARNAS